MTKDEALAKAVEEGCRAYVAEGEPESARWPDDYDADEQAQLRRDMRAAILAALRTIEPEWGLVRLLPDDPR
jgi:hypothetical protein